MSQKGCKSFPLNSHMFCQLYVRNACLKHLSVSREIQDTRPILFPNCSGFNIIPNTGKNTVDESNTKCVKGVNGKEKNVHSVANVMDLTNK